MPRRGNAGYLALRDLPTTSPHERTPGATVIEDASGWPTDPTRGSEAEELALTKGSVFVRGDNPAHPTYPAFRTGWRRSSGRSFWGSGAHLSAGPFQIALESVGGVEFYLMEQEGSRFSEFETAERCLASWKKLRAGA